MPRRKGKDPKIKLSQPDRSGPDPSEQTLIDLAEQRGLFAAADAKGASPPNGGDDLLTGRLGEAILWTLSLTMLHITLDVLVTHQYALDLAWLPILSRGAQAFPLILLLFYSFHPHPSPSALLPRVPPLLHQLLFFASSVAAGTYLIHVSNTSGYYATMKRAPPLGCLWIWSVIELELLWATGSLICCGAFLKYGDYSFL